MLVHFLPDARQRVGEGNNMLVFCAFAHFAKPWRIAVLLAGFCVPSRSLDMAAGEGANLDIGPGWRNSERLYPVQHARFSQLRAIRACVVKAGADLLSFNAPTRARDVPETRGLSGVLRIDDRLDIFSVVLPQEGMLPGMKVDWSPDRHWCGRLPGWTVGGAE